MFKPSAKFWKRLVMVIAVVGLVFLIRHRLESNHLTVAVASPDSTANIVEGSVNFESVFFEAPKVKALMATRFSSLDDFKKVVEIRYFNPKKDSGETSRVLLIYRFKDSSARSELSSGLNQKDIIKVRDGGIWEKLQLVFKSPFAAMNRLDLNVISKLARRRPAFFGEGDVAFYDLAEASVKNINTMQLAYAQATDSSEKGYLNTFNHITAQALITSLYSTQMADFVADVHERDNMPEIISGTFKAEQLTDPNNYPVDNYVDLINNEIGQDIGRRLVKKYRITRETEWTPNLLANYMNDLQSYYCWSFQIGMKPFKPTDELMIRFCEKIKIASGDLPYDELK